jgi:hypothetical protein
VDDLFKMLNSLVKVLPRLVSSASIQFRRFLVPRNLEIVQAAASRRPAKTQRARFNSRTLAALFV